MKITGSKNEDDISFPSKSPSIILKYLDNGTINNDVTYDGIGSVIHNKQIRTSKLRHDEAKRLKLVVVINKGSIIEINTITTQVINR